MRLSTLVLAVLPLWAGSVHADVCFTVLDRAGRVLHQSRRSPVDMSQPISATLYSRFPNASVMVFGSNNDVCEEVHNPNPARTGATPPGRRANRRL